MVQLRLKGDFFGSLTPMGSGAYALGDVQCEVEGDEVAYRLEMTVQVIHGKPVCTSLVAHQRPGGMPVTRRGLNSLPIEQLVRQIATMMAIQVTHGDGVVKYNPVDQTGANKVFAELAPKRGRRADPDDRRRRVEQAVGAYKDLTANRIKHPKPLIAREMRTSVSTVASLLAEGRRLGLLGPARPGRAGEIERDEG
jgi:hypothetical protein